MKAERGAARRAVTDLDVTLPDPPPEGIAAKPIKLSRNEQARMALRQKREGFNAPSKLPSMPGINALSFTVRYLPGGRNQFLEFVKLAMQNGDPTATAWWAVFADLIPDHRRRCSFDDVCFAAGVKPSALMSAVVGHCMEAMIDMGNMVAAVAHPAVMAAMSKSALNIDSDIGAEDRKLFLQGRGFLPTPKGASIHLHANASANAQAAAVNSADPSVPKFSRDIASLSSARQNVQRQIAESAPGLDVIDVPAIHEDAEA